MRGAYRVLCAGIAGALIASSIFGALFPIVMGLPEGMSAADTLRGLRLIPLVLLGGFGIGAWAMHFFDNRRENGDE